MSTLSVTQIIRCEFAYGLRGDASGNGRLGIDDAMTILLYLFRKRQLGACPDAGDVNDSGRITVADVVYLLRFLFDRGPAPPPPGFEEHGLDPTEDELDCNNDTPNEEEPKDPLVAG